MSPEAQLFVALLFVCLLGCSVAAVLDARGRVRQYADWYQQERHRSAGLLRQVQDMAERIATLRQSGMELPAGDVQFVPPEERPQPEQPWSAELQRFLNLIESEELLEQYEDKARDMRARGIPDDEIVAKFVSGEVWQ